MTDEKPNNNTETEPGLSAHQALPPDNLPLPEEDAPGKPEKLPPAKKPVIAQAPEIPPILPRHLRDLKPEEVYEPEQAPPAVPVTPEMKEEAAALEALNLRPRHILPAAKRREMKYPGEHPSPRLANDFYRYHRRTLKAFEQAGRKIRLAEPAGSSFLRFLEKLNGIKNLLPARPAATDHNFSIILTYARRKPKITADDIATLIGVKPKQAARCLERLAKSGDLIRYGRGSGTYYQSAKY